MTIAYQLSKHAHHRRKLERPQSMTELLVVYPTATIPCNVEQVPCWRLCRVKQNGVPAEQNNSDIRSKEPCREGSMWVELANIYVALYKHAPDKAQARHKQAVIDQSQLSSFQTTQSEASIRGQVMLYLIVRRQMFVRG